MVAQLKDGTFELTIAQHPAEIGYFGYIAAFAHLTGNPVPTAIGTGFTVMTKDNIDDPNVSQVPLQELVRARSTAESRQPFALAALRLTFVRGPHDDCSDDAHGETLPHPIILWIAQLRAWVFLIVLVVFFEIWARAAEGISFLFNIYNIQSILVFATAPLLLALGQTFVIISSGIDLSLGFVMGLSSVIAAHACQLFRRPLGSAAVRRDAGGDPFRGGGRRSYPASSMGCWSPGCRFRRLSARSGCTASRAARPISSPAA